MAPEGLGNGLIRAAYRSPRQNVVAEHWVGSCRREQLDRVTRRFQTKKAIWAVGTPKKRIPP